MARSKTAPHFKRYSWIEVRKMIKNNPKLVEKNYSALQQAVDVQHRLIQDYKKRVNSTRKFVNHLLRPIETKEVKK